MQTKSSLVKIFWSLGYVIVAVVGLRLTAEPSRAQNPPPRDRTVITKPWSVEPVRVVAAKNKRRDNIEIGKPFDDDDDWLDGFAVVVFNGSDKTVTAMSVEMVFRREAGDNRHPAAQDLYFGPSPTRPEYLQRDLTKVIKPGKTGEIVLTPDNYEGMKVLLATTGFPPSINRVELVVREVGFDDDSVLQTGALLLPDPHHPGDPTKKIRADKKRQHHANKNLQRLNGSSSASRLKTGSPTNPQSECSDKSTSTSVDCGFPGCHSFNDMISAEEGIYSIEEVDIHCTYTYQGTEH